MEHHTQVLAAWVRAMTGVTTIHGAEGMRGIDNEGGRRCGAVRSIALMMDVRGDEVGAGVGRASLKRGTQRVTAKLPS
jgi:hypothetical protein